MSDAVILANGVVVTGFEHPEIISSGAVVWQGERIVAVGPADVLRDEFRGARPVDAHGGLIVPGLVNLHHHFYSALARGLDPSTKPRNFAEVLDRLWWRLDRALDPETVRVSAQLSAADCIRWGCTTVFDHHASPSCIEGSLDLIADTVSDAGLSAVLCYEVTDRNGHQDAIRGLEENLRFVDRRRNDSSVRGTVGLHASFTLRDETLAAVVDRQPDGVGCHIHVAEDPLDVGESLNAFGKGPVQRLEEFGLLNARSLLAHGIHLAPRDYQTIARSEATIVHNPESNANNGVGYLDPVEVSRHGCLVGLGTDGMSSSVLRALRAAFLTHRASRGDPGAGFEVLPGLLGNNVRAARRFFEEPQLGELSVGAPADLIVIDAQPPTPLSGDNLFGHLVYGATEARVRHTVARGRLLLEDFAHTTLNPQEIATRASRISPDLWRRFSALHGGTSFLGD
jgi:putative selenium metabolism protein SsnA